ncbi:MAG TPA: TraR/DksA C4-type zinc finger protein [Acidimicrobiales bacterium]|nr:TraR/DksA C4-type zinc finger protein [Acidimicrobiales bacterium]
MTPGKKAPSAKTPAKGSTPRESADRRSPAGTNGAATVPTAKAAKAVKAVKKTVAGADRAEADSGHAKAAKPRVTPSAEPSGSGPQPKPAAKPKIGPYATDTKFLQEQQALLEHERAVYQGQATDLKAEADSLAQEREPGDVQFDEESGEGGTVAVDRERDLALSAQALAAVEEIDASILRIAARTYGACERCHQPIPKPRLRALPYARLCVACKSGGLSRR